MMQLHIDVDLDAIPFQIEVDPETGQVTAFNDDIRVMAIGRDEEEAHDRFKIAVVALAEAEIAAGRPLPGVIQSRIFA